MGELVLHLYIMHGRVKQHVGNRKTTRQQTWTLGVTADSTDSGNTTEQEEREGDGLVGWRAWKVLATLCTKHSPKTHREARRNHHLTMFMCKMCIFLAMHCKIMPLMN